jgi:CheY-like chemotaxis protein
MVETGQIETKTILVAEDDADVRNFVSRVLELEHYQVVGAGDGEEALELARTGEIALVLLDLRMPVLDGWSVLRQMRNDPALSSIPVIVLSASVSASLRNRVFALGATEYLSKPVGASALSKTVAQILLQDR